MDELDKLSEEVDRLHGLIETEWDVPDTVVIGSCGWGCTCQMHPEVKLKNPRIELVSTTAFDWLDNLRRTHDTPK